MAHIEVLDIQDADRWRGYLERIPLKYIAHYPNFLRVYEEYGDGVGECFIYEVGDSLVLYP